MPRRAFIKLVRDKMPPGGLDDGIHVLAGGIDPPPSWQEYLDDFKDEYQPHFLAIRECVLKEGIQGTTAGGMANDHYFKCSDDSMWAFTWRAWGDLMQSIADKREGYVAYYM